MLSTTCPYARGYAPSYPNLPKLYDSPPPLPATTPRLRPSVSGVPYMGALLSTDVRWLTACNRGRLLLWGRGPALEHRTRPHPSGGGDDVSRPCGFSIPKNTRIASGRCRIPPARIRGVSAVFLSNNHGQTIMVGRASVRVRFPVQPWVGFKQSWA